MSGMDLPPISDITTSLQMRATMEYGGGIAASVNGCIPLDLWNSSLTVGNSSPCAPDHYEKQQLKKILSSLLGGLIAFIMVGIGCAIEAKKVLKHIKKPTGIVCGIICQFAIMPLLGLAWASVFKMDDPETLSILIVGSCPGGTMSNIVAYWIGGDMELSSVMTATSVLISLAALPLLLFIYSRLVANTTLTVPYSTIGITVALIIVPLSVGALLRYKHPNTAIKVLKVFSAVGMIALIVVAAFSIYLFNEFWSFTTGQIIAAVFYPACGMGLGYAITSAISMVVPSLALTHSERRTISVETGIQNSQLAMAIVQLSGWSLQITGRVTVFPLMYAISQICWSLLYMIAYNIISYARDGECPKLSGRKIQENSGVELQNSADMVNPAFDAKA